MNNTREILRQFNTFTIQHPRFKLAIERIMESIETTDEMGAPASALLLGESGTGKSRVCRRVGDLLGYSEEKETDIGLTKVIPCIYCKILENFTTKKLAEQMLYRLGHPSTAPSNGTLLDRIIILLQTCETKLIIIDEFQQLAEKGAEKTKAALCDWVKTLLNEGNVPLLLAGLPGLAPIIDDNDQLSQRYPHRATLENLEYHSDHCGVRSEWTEVLAKFSAAMVELGNLTDYIFLSDEEFSLACYIYSAGNMRGLRFLLNGAFKRCLNRGDGCLTRSDFSITTCEVFFRNRIRPDINPFEATHHELNQILNKTP